METTSPSPTIRRSFRFCLEWPRWAIGARSLAESIQVAKLVMSSTRPEQSTEKVSTILATMRRSISWICSSLTWSMASQKRRWSSVAGGQLQPAVAGGPVPPAEKPSLEHGSTTRLAVARAM